MAAWLAARRAEGLQPHEIGAFVRSEAQIARAQAALAGMPRRVLDMQSETASGFASIGTMHLAKGLEFRAVVVMACDEDVLPLQARMDESADDADRQAIYDSERQLLYVACTRARDQLWVSGVAPGSEFLADMAG